MGTVANILCLWVFIDLGVLRGSGFLLQGCNPLATVLHLRRQRFTFGLKGRRITCKLKFFAIKIFQFAAVLLLSFCGLDCGFGLLDLSAPVYRTEQGGVRNLFSSNHGDSTSR